MSKTFSALQRQIDSAARNYRRDLDFLIKLQTARRKAAPEPPASATQIAEPVAVENGFVPPNPAPAPPDRPPSIPIRRSLIPRSPADPRNAPPKIPVDSVLVD